MVYHFAPDSNSDAVLPKAYISSDIFALYMGKCT